MAEGLGSYLERRRTGLAAMFNHAGSRSGEYSRLSPLQPAFSADKFSNMRRNIFQISTGAVVEKRKRSADFQKSIAGKFPKSTQILHIQAQNSQTRSNWRPLDLALPTNGDGSSSFPDETMFSSQAQDFSPNSDLSLQSPNNNYPEQSLNAEKNLAEKVTSAPVPISDFRSRIADAKRQRQNRSQAQLRPSDRIFSRTEEVKTADSGVAEASSLPGSLVQREFSPMPSQMKDKTTEENQNAEIQEKLSTGLPDLILEQMLPLNQKKPSETIVPSVQTPVASLATKKTLPKIPVASVLPSHSKVTNVVQREISPSAETPAKRLEPNSNESSTLSVAKEKSMELLLPQKNFGKETNSNEFSSLPVVNEKSADSFLPQQNVAKETYSRSGVQQEVIKEDPVFHQVDVNDPDVSDHVEKSARDPKPVVPKKQQTNITEPFYTNVSPAAVVRREMSDDVIEKPTKKENEPVQLQMNETDIASDAIPPKADDAVLPIAKALTSDQPKNPISDAAQKPGVVSTLDKPGDTHQPKPTQAESGLVNKSAENGSPRQAKVIPAATAVVQREMQDEKEKMEVASASPVKQVDGMQHDNKRDIPMTLANTVAKLSKPAQNLQKAAQIAKDPISSVTAKIGEKMESVRNNVSKSLLQDQSSDQSNDQKNASIEPGAVGKNVVDSFEQRPVLESKKTADTDLNQLAEDILPLIKRALEIEAERSSFF